MTIDTKRLRELAEACNQAKVEVAAGVDEFIQESLGFWGRFAAKMQKERDSALARVAELEREVERMRAHVEHNDEEYKTIKDVLRSVHGVYQHAVAWREYRRNWPGDTTADARLVSAIDAALAGKEP